MLSKIESDVYVNGTLRSKTLEVPPGTLADADVAADAGIAASKLQHQHAVTYHQAGGADVVAATVPVHYVRGISASLIDVQAVPSTAPAGGDLQCTVDVQVGNQAAAYASVLQSPVRIDSSISDREVVTGVVGSASLAEGDSLRVVVAVSGSTGTQAQGLLVRLTLREDAD